MIPLVPASRAGPAEGPLLLPAVRDPEEPVGAFLGSEMWDLGDRRLLVLTARCCSLVLLAITVPSRAEWQRKSDRQSDRRERDGEISVLTSSWDPVVTKTLPFLNSQGSHSVHGNRQGFL